MTYHKQHIDTSEELHLYRGMGGVKLVRPDRTHLEAGNFFRATGFRVNDVIQFDFNSYLLDTAHAVQNMSESSALLFGANSIKDAIGKKASDFTSKKYAVQIMQNDLNVMKSKQINIIEESAIHNNGDYCSYLTIKSPLYGVNNQVIGVLGFSISFEHHNMAESLSRVAQLGILSTFKAPFCRDIFQPSHLTPREIEILYFLIKGKTAKQMGVLLGISKRTVEQHLINIKVKMKVSSKSDLIEKAFDLFSS